ncbi:MAG: BamA/TamA family outer membrane protein [Myxococcaceae bacterium]|nr:BamA/TamA family outer membrane protein [Myxococcaceae bacterium]
MQNQTRRSPRLGAFVLPGRFASALLPLAVLAAPLAQAEESVSNNAPVAARPQGLAFQGLPIINYNSDEGVGYGALAQLVDRGDGTQEPYRMSVIAQFFQTTRGISSHYISVDAPRAFGSEWRLGGKIRYGVDLYAPYYGVGNESGYDADFGGCDDRDALASDPDACPGNPEFRGLRYYSYKEHSFPETELNLRRTLSGPWKLFLGHRFQMNQVRARYAAEELGQSTISRLEEDAYAGRIRGFNPDAENVSYGRTSELQVALQYDERDQEASTTRGMFHELAVRGAAQALGGMYNYAGATLNLRFFQPIPVMEGRPIVVAVRGIGDVLTGEVPFFRLASFGGISGGEGLGGVGSVRGILKNRAQGAVKVMGNAELRWMPLAFDAGSQHFDVGAVGFVDAGRVWSDLKLADGGGLTAGAGGGLRVAWNREFVVRVDYARGITDPTTGLYIEFGQSF